MADFDAMKQEWTDYYDEMRDAIRMGYFDDILDMVGADLAQRKKVKEALHHTDSLPVTKAANTRYELVGKVVKMNTVCSPAYLRGTLVRVESVMQKNLRVVMLSDHGGSRFLQGEVFRCPVSLLDVQVAHDDTRSNRRRYY